MVKGCLYTFVAGWVIVILCVGCLSVVIMSIPKPTAQQIAASEAASKRYDAEKRARRLVEDVVRMTLKSPSTAKFTLVAKSDENGDIDVEGYVDAQNSFGAMLRNRVTSFVGAEGILYLSLDGKVLINKIDK